MESIDIHQFHAVLKICDQKNLIKRFLNLSSDMADTGRSKSSKFYVKKSSDESESSASSGERRADKDGAAENPVYGRSV